MTNQGRLVPWSISIWIVFIGALIGLIVARYYLLTPWLGSSVADFLILLCLLILVIAGSRFTVKKLHLRSNLTSLLLLITIWSGLSVVSDLLLHQFFSTEDWNRIFGSSILVQTDFWIVLILYEIVGPFLIIWLVKLK